MQRQLANVLAKVFTANMADGASSNAYMFAALQTKGLKLGRDEKRMINALFDNAKEFPTSDGTMHGVLQLAYI